MVQPHCLPRRIACRRPAWYGVPPMQMLSRLLAFALLLSTAGARAETPALPAGTAAIVNGEAIPQRVVDAFLRNDQEALEINPVTLAGRDLLSRLRGGVLDELIDRALIAQEVRARGLEPTGAQIDAAEQPVRDFNVTEERYAAFLRQNGFTRAEYRDAVLGAAARGQVLIEALTKDLTATDAEVAAEYEAHRTDADLQWPERVTGAHILVNARPGVLGAQLEHDRGLPADSPELTAAVAEETERRRVCAESLRAEAAAPGADFAALAAERSDDLGTRRDGGSLGTFARGVHPLALDDAFFALPVGAIGPVVRTDYGFHVIKTLDHRPAGPRTLAEATPMIRERLLAARRGERLRGWLRAARARADIVRATDG